MDDTNVVPLFPMVDRPSRRDDDDAVEPTLREALGDVLRTERTDQDRTLADVADDAAVSLPYLSEVERGLKDPSSAVVEAIADALELPLDVLLERTADRLRIGSQRDTGIQLRAA
ncbi:MAG: helix-turn-helix domain-containing protein [Actinomycetota bacterium]